MNGKSPVVAELELQVLAALAIAGSRSAAKHLSEPRSTRRADVFDPRVLQAAAWRVSVAGTLGLVSDDFVNLATQAFTETDNLEPVWPIIIVGAREPVLELETDIREAHRILRGFISLDEEYTSDTALQLLSLHVSAVGDIPIQSAHTSQLRLELAKLSLVDPRRRDSADQIARLCREYPEELMNLMLLAQDIESFVDSLADARDVAALVRLRFDEVLSAYRIVREHRGLEVTMTVLDDVYAIGLDAVVERAITSSSEDPESGLSS